MVDKPKRKRGRPRKIPLPVTELLDEFNSVENIPTNTSAEGFTSKEVLTPTVQTSAFSQGQDPNPTGSQDGVSPIMNLNLRNQTQIQTQTSSQNDDTTHNGAVHNSPAVPSHELTSLQAPNSQNIPSNTQYMENILNYDSEFYTNSNYKSKIEHTEKQPGDVEKRLEKMESMISLLLNKMTQSPTDKTITPSSYNSLSSIAPSPTFKLDVTENSSFTDQHKIPEPDSYAANDAIAASSENIENECVQKWNGLFMHTSIFFLSKIGLLVLEQKMEQPETLNPIKQILQVSTPFEKKILSIWTNPISSSELHPLPSRKNIESLIKHLDLSVLTSKIINFDYLKYLFKLYCDFRDGLIPEPTFSYSDYLLMNTSLLVACIFVNEVVRLEISNNVILPEFTSIKEIEYKLLDNSLFYFHRISVISCGLSAVSASLLLAFYAENASLSRSAYLISSTAIRLAQELGLHIEDAYRGLKPKERSLRLNTWWACYVFDKEMSVRWGHSPVINDDDVSTPPIPGFEAFWSPNLSDDKSESKRSLLTCEIQAALNPLLDNINDATILEQYLTTDFAFITSKVYNNFLKANALKHLSRDEAQKLIKSTVHELDCWRKNIPEKIRPNVNGDEAFYDYINTLKSCNSKISIYTMVLATAYHVRYHHIKLMIYRAYAKYNFIYHGSKVTELEYGEPVLSARSILKVSCIVDGSFGYFANYFMFYPFNSFLAICGYYIYSDDRSQFLESDLQLLIDCLRSRRKPFLSNDVSSERGRLVDLVLKGMLYATYKTCCARFGEIKLDGIDILQDILDIESGKKTADELVTVMRNDISETSSVPRRFCKLPFFSTSFDSPADNTKSPSDTVRFNSAIRGIQNNNNNGNGSDSSRLTESISNGANNNVDRTPSVSFLLSTSNSINEPTEQPLNPNSGFEYFDTNFRGRDTIFQNMLSIPNYFGDNIFEGTHSAEPLT